MSVLVGPIGAGAARWRRWASATGRGVVVARHDLFPRFEWLHSVAEQVDVPAAAIQCLARRAGREPDEFLAAWQAKTTADRERFWKTLEPNADDDLLREVVKLAVRRGPPDEVASSLSNLGESIVPVIAAPGYVGPLAGCPVCRPTLAEGFLAVSRVATKWATRVPALPIAVAVPAGVWDHYFTTAAESRMKALLREGELPLPFIDASTVEQTLTEAGMVASTAKAVAAAGADAGASRIGRRRLSSHRRSTDDPS